MGVLPLVPTREYTAQTVYIAIVCNTNTNTAVLLYILLLNYSFCKFQVSERLSSAGPVFSFNSQTIYRLPVRPRNLQDLDQDIQPKSKNPTKVNKNFIKMLLLDETRSCCRVHTVSKSEKELQNDLLPTSRSLTLGAFTHYLW